MKKYLMKKWKEKPVMGRVPFNRLKHTQCIETAAAKTVMAMPANNRLSKNYTNQQIMFGLTFS